jgi:hypothetical protein
VRRRPLSSESGLEEARPFGGNRRPISAQIASTMPGALAKSIELGSRGTMNRSSHV